MYELYCIQIDVNTCKHQFWWTLKSSTELKKKQFAHFVSLRYCSVVPILCIIIVPFWNYRTNTKIPQSKINYEICWFCGKTKKSTNSTLYPDICSRRIYISMFFLCDCFCPCFSHQEWEIREIVRPYREKKPIERAWWHKMVLKACFAAYISGTPGIFWEHNGNKWIWN